MFSKPRHEKPLPPANVLPLRHKAKPDRTPLGGIELGQGVWWNPETLPNAHIVAIGASGSGKTQTLKGICFALHIQYMESKIILIDFHGDQDVEGEACYPLHMASPWGINPLIVNLDPEGAAGQTCRRSLSLPC